MKTIVTLLLISMTLLANSLQDLPNSFSKSERELLLKESLDSSSILHSSDIYQLKRGWNKVTTPKDGIYLEQSFKDISQIKYITTYEKVNKLWAVYAPNKKYPKDNILFLKYLEPNITFFVLANEDVKVKTNGKKINKSCLKAMNTPGVSTLLSSAFNENISVSKDNSMSFKTRYLSHHTKGLYDDTRLLLIYEDLNSTRKASYRYGPAKPRAVINFTKEYEAKSFFIYDYKLEKCFKGVFPSVKIPPLPILQEIK